MIPLNSCCYALSLRAGTITLLCVYVWLALTYIILLLQFFHEHTVPVSILIGIIFITWTVCACVGLYGVVNRKNGYYLIPEIAVDLLDIFLRIINLIFHLFTKKLAIPRYTVFGTNWAGTPATNSTADGSITSIVYNLFDEKYPLPDVFAALDLAIRIYFLLIIFSYFLQWRNKMEKKTTKKAKRASLKKTSSAKAKKTGTSTSTSTRKTRSRY